MTATGWEKRQDVHAKNKAAGFPVLTTQEETTNIDCKYIVKRHSVL